MSNIILPQVNKISSIDDNANFMIESNGSILRYPNKQYFDTIAETMDNKFNIIENTTEEKFNTFETKLLELTNKVENALNNLSIIKLNYSILAYNNLNSLMSSKPEENTIGIITDIPITTWQLGAEIPVNPIEGMIWIETGTSQTAGSFPSLKLDNNTFNPVNPWAAYQYIDYNWEMKDVMIYIDSQWRDFNTIPIFDYTGEFQILNDDDEFITSSNKNWKIKFLTSGILTFHSLNGAKAGIDVFLVGGGGGGCSYGGNYYGPGGGGGYTTTDTYKSLNINHTYEIVVGEGGAGSIANSSTGPATNGTASTAFTFVAEGGTAPKEDRSVAGNGGSAGAPLVATSAPHAGFTDGAGNGEAGLGPSWLAGKGQGTTTREFGEMTGKLYSTGGAANSVDGANAKANTGDGGGGGSSGVGGNGGSGIVIIRNARGTKIS